MNRSRYLLFTVLVFLTACSSKNYFLEAGYENLKVSDATLLIPKLNEISIRQEEMVFNPRELDSIKNKLLINLNTNLTKTILPISTFRNVGYMEFKQQPELEKHFFEINNGELLELAIPKQKIPTKSDGEVYMLFLEDPIIDLLKYQRESSDPAKHYSVSATPAGGVSLTNLNIYDNQFVFSTKYFIYDNNKAKVVLCGATSTKHRYTERTNLDDLVTKTTETIAKDIIVNSPFNN